MNAPAALADMDCVRSAFFGRAGGVSEGIYASLNCGFGSGDDPERVARNRARAASRAGVDPEALVTAHQTHSTRVALVDRPWPRDRAPRVDAMVTRSPQVALGILTADCAPVLLADAEARVVGAAHAGWRGALDGVLEATVEAMLGLGAAVERISAAIGPCIAQASYEVGTEFLERFRAADPASERFFRPGRPGHAQFDLPAFVAARLAAAGLRRIEQARHDTCAEPDDFFSYRRSRLQGRTDYGRNLSLIALEG
ncbi:MAG TPA: peptidoglycan editing factor PgeF [Dongiaceae bacterium]|nr:peptidoglycan editing factor PgeF [Dongiaceae bacterium]